MTSRILVFARSGLLALLLLSCWRSVLWLNHDMRVIINIHYCKCNLNYNCTVSVPIVIDTSAIRNSIVNEQCCVLSIKFANDQLTVLMTVAVARHPYHFKTVSNCMTFKISGVSYFEFVKSIMKASYRSDPLLIMLNLHSMFKILYLHSIIVLYTATRFVPACIIIHQFA